MKNINLFYSLKGILLKYKFQKENNGSPLHNWKPYEEEQQEPGECPYSRTRIKTPTGNNINFAGWGWNVGNCKTIEWKEEAPKH